MIKSHFQSITERLLSDEVARPDLKVALTEYKELLLGLTDTDWSSSKSRKDIVLENGMAIGMSWAASCLDDPIRTQKFLRGTKLAIEKKLYEGKTPVHLLYAGTGPFATLILPLLSHFSKKELVVTLLDVNPQSVENVKKIIDHLKFEDRVVEIRCDDATQTVFKNASTFDILLSETMQHALQKELQVKISSHLLNQMSEDAELIPQSIDLDLVKIESLDSDDRTTKIGELMRANSQFYRNEFPILPDWKYEKRIDLSQASSSEDGFLAISTRICVFENESIEWNESGLTVPKILAPMGDVYGKGSITTKYAIDPDPGFSLST